MLKSKYFILLLFIINSLQNDSHIFYFSPLTTDFTRFVQVADTIPKIFAEGIVSLKDRYEFGCTISKDGKELYIGVELGNRTEILHYELIEGTWGNPKIIVSDSIYGMNDPMLSPDGKQLYFITNLHHRDDPNRNDHDIYYVEKTSNGWSEPKPANDHINSLKNEYFMSFTADGSMYFGSNVNTDYDNSHDFDIYKSSYEDGKFQKAVALPPSVNTRGYEADVFVAPDESYIIFCSRRRDGFGQGDLYISFHDGNGEWTEAVNMGPAINDTGHQLCPYVSPDEKYFLYTSNRDIMIVSTDIFKRYMK